MKKVLALLFSLFLLSSPYVFADDISDFQIEGISVGDSLLDHMTENEIFEEIRSNTNQYPYLKEPYKYLHINYYPDSSTYYGLAFLIKNNSINEYVTSKDEKIIILSINGFIEFNENKDGCIQKHDEIVEVLSEMFPNQIKREWSSDYSPDPSGNSNVFGIEFQFNSGAEIEVQCIDMEKTFRIKSNWSEGLFVSIHSKETVKWLNDYK